MKNKIKLFCIGFMSLFGTAQAQQSLNSAGGNASGAGGSASYSVGQVSYVYFSNSSGQMNQGVQQVFNLCETEEGTDIISSCAPITWIDGNTYTSSNNSATHLLVGAAQNGCDSLVTLNFTLWPCTQLQPGDCGAIDVTMNQTLRAVNVGYPVYRFKVSGPNNGGPGWVSGSFIYDSPTRAFKFSNIPGSHWGETYSVEVAVGDGQGNFGPFGNACNVTLMGTIPTTQLQNSDCGASVSSNTNVFANLVSGAMAYRFRITGNNSASWPGNTIVITKTERKIKMSEAVGSIWGQTYQIEVAIQNANGVWGDYGLACYVTVTIPSTQIQSTQCNISGVLTGTTIFADAISDATGYRFKITGSNTAGWINNSFILDRSVRNMKMSMVPGFIAGEEYIIEVSVKDASNVYVPYGSQCTITMSGTPGLVENNNGTMLQNKLFGFQDFEVVSSHNPFSKDFGIQVLNTNDFEAIQVSIYDMSGKLIERNTVNPMDIESARFGSNLASGMYMIEVKQGSNQAVFRQVKN